MTSRSRFYVDTPRDPSQRHSMFVTHSELAQRQDLSSNSSSATLPSTAGSVDRLTGLDEKKSSRFFTLKPKTSFSLRPFFKSTSSLASQSPLKRRKALLERRDSYVQTEEIRPELDDVGVQTLNASTVDVPVQTCLETWDEGNSYGQKRLAYATSRTSPFWSQPSVSTKALSNTLSSKNAVKDPLASPKVIKYAAPGDSEKTALHHQSADSPVNVNSCQTVSSFSPSIKSSSQSVPVKYFTAKKLTGNTLLVSDTSETQPVNIISITESDNHTNLVTSNVNSSEKVLDEKPCNNETSAPQGYKTSDKQSPEVSNNFKYSVPQNIELPLSALKTERTDSPSRRFKSVHFDLPGSESTQTVNDSSKPRNIDKDFEALLKDLNILTENENDISLSLNPIPLEKSISVNLITPSFKSALDSLREDFLDPIPENVNEFNEIEPDIEPKLNPLDIENKNTNLGSKLDVKTIDSSPVTLKKSVCSSFEASNQNLVEENKNDSLTPTSLSIFASAKSSSNPETDSLDGNVYDNVIKEENTVSAVTLPTLPSFFETSQSQTVEISDFDEYIQPNNSEILPDKDTLSTMSLETESDSNKLSRSSSRSSFRSNYKLGNDTSQEPISKFDSCENLDQLEEEIIRSLYSPADEKMEEDILKNIELPPSESFQNSGTTATHMRRVILDQLLSGKSVEDIVPNYPVYKRAHSLPETERKFKQPIKYTSVLTKMSFDENECVSSNLTSNSTPNNANVPENLNIQKENVNISTKNYENVANAVSPKKASSLFIFPEDSISHDDSSKSSMLEISASESDKKGPSILEVRRSSWTPQTNVESQSDNVRAKSSLEKESISSKKSGQCDFTNCLLPSKIQNSPFLAKINTRSMSPCRSSPVPYQTSSPVNNTSIKPNGSTKSPAIGECDFGSCLKPSQVQNSLFTAELSEITAGKSTNSLRAGSPLTVRTHSPLPLRTHSPLPVRTHSPLPVRTHSPLSIRSTSLDLPIPISSGEKDNEEHLLEPKKHKTEISITLQTASKPTSNVAFKSEMSPILENIDNSSTYQSENFKSNVDSNTSSNLKQETDTIVPPPPPPPPLPPPPPEMHKLTNYTKNTVDHSMDNILQIQKSNLNSVEISVDSGSAMPKNPIMIELEQKLQDKNDSYTRNSDDKNGDQCSISTVNSEITNVGRPDIKLNGISGNVPNGNQNGYIGLSSSEPRDYGSFSPYGKKDSHLPETTELTFSPNTVITDQPPPPGAVLLDKKITVDGDQVHTEKVFAIPMKEVLKEKTSTTKFIPAPPKYEGIGPTEDGIPTGLRNSVKKENMHNWYKTMFKSLHKADSSNDSQEYIIGYTSEPETSKKDMMVRKKSSTLDNRSKYDAGSNLNKQSYPPSAKSSIEVYNVRPRLIEDYEPGYSSVTDDQVTISKRYLPSKNTVKPTYEFKNGYESDSNITKKRDQPEALKPEQQKMWYREIQKGGDIPQFGLGKIPPEKPKDPTIGPLPPPPLNYSTQPTYQQAVRPSTLPSNYSNQNGNSNGYCQQMNGAYEMQMRNAIHSEMQQRMSPSSNQLSPPNRSIMKSPSRSPDMKVPAKALFDFKSESPKEIPLKKGDTILILRQLDKNWYEGERNGVVGIFPMSYVEIIPPEHIATPVKVRTEGSGRALYDFVAQTSIELTVRKGDTITLLRRVDTNWFEGVINNKKGIVPISYIQVLQEPLDKSSCSPVQKSYPVSPSLENQEKNLKPSSVSPSTYSPSSISPVPVVLEKRKLLNKKSSNLVEPVMYRALYSYSPQNSDELELQEGDNVYVVEMCDDGWYVGTSVRNGVFGIFPGNYVEKVC